MKRTMKKMVSLGLVAAISLTMLVGCGNSKETADNTASDNTANDTSDTSVKEETKTAENAKIGVLVQDVSGEEALGFRTYYEDYVANQYGCGKREVCYRKIRFTGISGSHLSFK